MADKKISQLSNATTPLAGTETLPIVQGGATVKATVANVTANKVTKVTSTDNAVVRFDSTSGDVQNSNLVVDDTGNITVKSATKAGVAFTFDTTGASFTNDNIGVIRFQGDGTAAYTSSITSYTDGFPNNMGLRFSTVPDGSGPVDRLNLYPSGNIAVLTGNLIIGTSGKGIDFSATPGTGTSELLSDYEEGTWTVIDASGAGLTLVTATGFYTKIGRVVYWQANVDYPVTADVSNALLGGLPFTISEGSSPGRSGSSITATTVASLVQTLQITPTNVRLYKTGFVRATNAELSGATIYLAGFYVV
jgi:hypothetical protein